LPLRSPTFFDLPSFDAATHQQLGLVLSNLSELAFQGIGDPGVEQKLLLYQTAETLTHLRQRLCLGRAPYPIGPMYVFAMDVLIGLMQDESASASFGISKGLKRAIAWPLSETSRIYATSSTAGPHTGAITGWLPLFPSPALRYEFVYKQAGGVGAWT
jgi:hypothetical protein